MRAAHTVHRPLPSLVLILSAIIVAAHGCIVSDNKCDENQIEDTAGVMYSCRCAPGFVLSKRGYGCDPCGANEEAAAGACVCKAGFSRANLGAPCLAIEGSAMGVACSDE